MSKEVSRHGDWAVTDDGLRYVGSYTDYFISKERLSSTDWVEHVGNKTFVIKQDFVDAYNEAVTYHSALGKK
ncbi:hypothetical protein [Vibrio kanaloae]|uniref:hypothetical protein n=1 Tax=Vibrio kanaloae TaxID=170673 RepID=UPI00124487DF|nr:hypothetical protein [Vibrio kanaloae]KAB0465272.1 hypothetical protein F7Q89_00570 [Vibrio kanaloae]